MGIRSTSNIQSFIDDFYRSGTDASLAAPDTASASGGVKITDGDNVYHIFLGNSGPDYAATAISEETFTINSGTITDAEILVVGGGGGGKNDGGGGGGAGAVYHATGVPLPSSPIPITIGERGTGNTTSNAGDTTFGPVTAQGGGYGNDGGNGNPGGSGGGGGASTNATNAYAGGSTTAVTTPSPWPGPATQGHAGGQGYHASGQWASGGGGGGAGAVGSAGDDANAGDGGIGIQNLIAGPASEGYGGIGAPGPGGATSGWFCGGGGGLSHNGGNGTGGTYNGSSNVSGGPYAGGAAAHLGVNNVTGAGEANTGGGGGAGNTETGRGRGGSGIVVVRYKYAQVAANTAAATGGSVSFYTCPSSSIIGAGQKTIHTFFSSGTFETPATFGTKTVEYLVVGGGGGAFTGGGGAGGVRHGTRPIGNNATISVIVGGGGAARSTIGSPSQFGASYSVNGGGSPTGPGGSAQTGVSGGGGNQGGSVGSGGGRTGVNYPGNSDDASPSDGWGYAGQPGTSGDKSGGGGGGAGGQGTTDSLGGPGIQLPSTFRDPNGFQYDKFPDHPWRPSTAPGWWVAGGGAGTVYTPFPQASPPLGPTPYSSDYNGMGGAGGGASRNIADPRYPVYGFNGMSNTGGGGAGGTPYTTIGGAVGGSGVVIVAYPT